MASSPAPRGAAAREPRDRALLEQAVALAGCCEPSQTAYSVGSVIADAAGRVLATGFSRELGPAWHAEEVALHKARQAGLDLADATIYASMEPCGLRLSGRKPCADHILEAGIRRVVLALREPPKFVENEAIDRLQRFGVAIVEIPELAEAARLPNRHLLGGG
ncbi:diaminohydroxyphosphoribosylaminopyrimidine deaminase [Tistlia consotensis]|uniref:Diaminohydroxyphosphoribosylaminopyrimidine deaminase n=1 Tax=Tistlia consotensis USBA 355 TaxID=560819 RepID=A0A1Y6C623_9PROT|nr:diaminohydroxyphosphoribosylaminopyrimidine deaminase [Tistlia consotensis USBA 355]SNR79095.1 diaminohydroxyphosphoribosylaminopyrimidine deaminase [Tistlia consotensis]